MERGISKEITEMKELLDVETPPPSVVAVTTIPQLKECVESLSKRLNRFLDESNVNLTSEEMYGILKVAIQQVEQEQEEKEVYNECAITPPPPPPPPPISPPPNETNNMQLNGTPTLESLGLTTSSMALLRIKDTTTTTKTPSKDSSLLHSDDIPSSPQLHTTTTKKKEKTQNLLSMTEDLKRVSYSSSIIQSPTLKTQTLSESLIKKVNSNLLLLQQQQQDKENIPSTTTSTYKNLIRDIELVEYSDALDISLKNQFSFEFLCGVVSWLNEVLQEKYFYQDEDEEEDTYYFKKTNNNYLLKNHHHHHHNCYLELSDLEGLDRPAGILLVLMKLQRIEKVITTDDGENKMYRVL